jgi:hypothetical protein
MLAQGRASYVDGQRSPSSCVSYENMLISNNYLAKLLSPQAVQPGSGAESYVPTPGSTNRENQGQELPQNVIEKPAQFGGTDMNLNYVHVP